MIPTGTFAQMLEAAQPGDYVVMWNHNPVASLIEYLTGGPSHVFTLAKFPEFSEWVEMEAVFLYGTRILPATHYANLTSKMVLCRRKGATQADIDLAIGRGLQAMGRRYEVTEEIEGALEHILPAPLAPHMRFTENSLYCSGLEQDEWQTGSVPFTPSPTGGNLTPQQTFEDALTLQVFQVN